MTRSPIELFWTAKKGGKGFWFWWNMRQACEPAGGRVRCNVHEAETWRRSKGDGEQPDCQVKLLHRSRPEIFFSLYEIGSVVSSPGPEPDPPIWKIYDGFCKQDRKVGAHFGKETAAAFVKSISNYNLGFSFFHTILAQRSWCIPKDASWCKNKPTKLRRCSSQAHFTQIHFEK